MAQNIKKEINSNTARDQNSSVFTYKKNMVLGMILVLCTSTLLQTDLFINSFYTQQFAFLLISALLISLTGFIFIFQFKELLVIPTTLLIFVTVTYFLLNSFLVNTSISTKALFLITSYLLCFVLPIILKSLNINPIIIVNCLITVGIIEIIWFLIQYVTSEGNNYLNSVGAWINPNITAIFLTLLTPYLLYDAINEKKTVSIIILAFFLFVILLLKCRTAYLGVIVVSTLVIRAKFINKKTFFKISFKKAAIAFIILLVLLISLYFLKQNSSDSRLFIWKQSINMIFEKPLWGYGYGSVERNYNLFQANYFEYGNYTEQEVSNAAHINMTYNEFIETTIEGGVISLLLFCGFLSFVLFLALKTANRNVKEEKLRNSSDKKVHIGSTIGLIALILMSIINFTILALPIMLLFIFYTSFIISYGSINSKNILSSPVAVKIFGIILISGGIYLSAAAYSECTSELKISKAAKLAIKKDYPSALNILEDVPLRCRNNQDYLQTLANIQYYSGDKKSALTTYQNASKFYSSPELYQQIGNCAVETNQFPLAISSYQMASNIQPNRFTPKYLLMHHYVKMRDSANAFKLANEILQMDEKIPSVKIDMYKQIATRLLKKN